MKIPRLFFFVFLILISSAKIFPATILPEKVPEENSFVVHFSAEDFGACISKIVIHTENKIMPQSVHSSDFVVKRMTRKTGKRIYIEKFNSEIECSDAFVSDENGNKIESESNFVTLSFDIRPENFRTLNVLTTGLSKSVGKVDDFFSYTIINKKLGLSVKNCSGMVNKNASRFSFGVYDGVVIEYDDDGDIDDEDEVPINYAFFKPDSANSASGSDSKLDGKIPLVVWFHGMGEGGKNKASPILNAKVTNLASEEIQSKFPNGFCILAPQCPTGWLMVSERTIGGIHYWAPVDKDKVKNKISGGMKSAKDTVTMPMRFLKQKVRQAFTGNSVSDDEDETEAEEEKIPFGSFSYYTFLMKDLIDSVISENPEIDTSRIFVGGCSAGGYMTLNMILVFRYFFRAAFPTCEFYLDSKITDEQIQFLSSFPIFFTYAKNDTTVDPLKATIPTIERMKKNGAKDFRCTEYEDVHDTSGRFFGEDGSAYQYEGHASWIYTLNNDNGIFDWLSQF
ncbi:MAG: hypothetical protein IKP49_09810 [Treponema sp.]|nr:hypothetical protein [Treponema sp.]